MTAAAQARLPLLLPQQQNQEQVEEQERDRPTQRSGIRLAPGRAGWS